MASATASMCELSRHGHAARPYATKAAMASHDARVPLDRIIDPSVLSRPARRAPLTAAHSVFFMASALSDRLSRLVKSLRGQARITEANVQDMLREIRMALLEADVALPVVREFIA